MPVNVDACACAAEQQRQRQHQQQYSHLKPNMGPQFRKAHCMVKVNNATQSVDNALCEDAGLSLPDVVEKCGGIECSRWETSVWTPCLTSRCLSRHRAAQIRDVVCRSVNGSDSGSCDESERPIARQECENERCKAVWRVENWSEVCDSLHVNLR